MKVRSLFVARRLLPLILLLAAGLPGRAQDQAAPESEKARQLTERVDQLYQLFVSGGWREVEAFVSEVLMLDFDDHEIRQAVQRKLKDVNGRKNRDPKAVG